MSVSDAAQENVLIAVDACKYERVIAVISNVMRFTKPQLQREEVEAVMQHLRLAGLVEWHAAITAVYYELTEHGERVVAEIIARAAPEV